ncbi:MAG TPA: hypothetical protein VIY48_00220 [Candidatus Paceibacterota bacterium]
MKRFFLFIVFLLPYLLLAQLPPATTPYTRSFLRSVDPGNARGSLVLDLNLTNAWYWLATCTNTGDRYQLGLFQSSNGTNWTQISTNVYQDPDAYTNNTTGPTAREGALQYDNGKFWTMYNYDPFNTNYNSQGLGIAYSYDLTNWYRKTVLYPYGKTNNGHMFAGYWYWEGGTNYFIGAYKSSPTLTASKDVFEIHRLDDSYTNWSAAGVIRAADPGLGVYDFNLLKVGSTYWLFESGGFIETNATGMYGPWFVHPGTDDLQFNLSWNYEAPRAFYMGGTTFWLLANNSDSQHTPKFAVSTDMGVTWTEKSSHITGIQPASAFFGGGIIQTPYGIQAKLGGNLEVDAKAAFVTNGLVIPQVVGYPTNLMNSSSGNTNWIIVNTNGSLIAMKTNATGANLWIIKHLAP